MDIGEQEEYEVTKALKEGWMSGIGPVVDQFERALSSRIEVPNSIAVSNGTIALELVLRSMNIGPGDLVVVPALTFAAPAMSVVAVGATPLIVDVDAETWVLDPLKVAEAMRPKVRAIIAVDLLGHPADYEALANFGVPVIQDAAEAHGSNYRGRVCGSQGDAAIFSFYANKTITTGEGGAVCSANDDLARRMRLMVNHGMIPDGRYEHNSLGRNFRMTSLNAAVGIAQLRRWESIVANRQIVTTEYRSRLSAAGFRIQAQASWAEPVWWLASPCVPSRDETLERLISQGIDARRVWPALTQQPFFRRFTQIGCPAAEEIARTGIQLPTSSLMRPADVRNVCDRLESATGDK